MKNNPLIPAAALSALLFSAPSFAGKNYGYCEVISSTHVYYSGIIDFPDRTSEFDAATNFYAYLKSAYGHEAGFYESSNCRGFAHTRQEVEKSMRTAVNDHRNHKDDIKIVRTGWTP